ncbi:MAG: 5'-nucleotidase C-terminal domain-containing protein, partial [Erysipelotrichaceae bacterium]|nr:5'-nucleotidase C-terminal domain-containing protein [Erysipelotrichaceae bacterium]
KTALQVDIFMLGSGSIRAAELGPVITLLNLKECLPFEEDIHLLKVTGKQLKRMMLYILRDEAFAEGAHTEFFQLSEGLKIEYMQKSHVFLQFSYKGEIINDYHMFTFATTHYHYLNFEKSFGIPIEEVKANGADRVISTSTLQIVEEYLIAGRRLTVRNPGRLILHLNEPSKENRK